MQAAAGAGAALTTAQHAHKGFLIVRETTSLEGQISGAKVMPSNIGTVGEGHGFRGCNK